MVHRGPGVHLLFLPLVHVARVHGAAPPSPLLPCCYRSSALTGGELAQRHTMVARWVSLRGFVALGAHGECSDCLRHRLGAPRRPAPMTTAVRGGTAGRIWCSRGALLLTGAPESTARVLGQRLGHRRGPTVALGDRAGSMVAVVRRGRWGYGRHQAVPLYLDWGRGKAIEDGVGDQGTRRSPQQRLVHGGAPVRSRLR